VPTLTAVAADIDFVAAGTEAAVAYQNKDSNIPFAAACRNKDSDTPFAAGQREIAAWTSLAHY